MAVTGLRGDWRSASTMPGALSVVLSLHPLRKLSVDSLGYYKVSLMFLYSSPKVSQLDTCVCVCVCVCVHAVL